jgi:hypothetical protein
MTAANDAQAINLVIFMISLASLSCYREFVKVRHAVGLRPEARLASFGECPVFGIKEPVSV